MSLLHSLLEFLRVLLEIGILWVFYYWFLVFFQGTMAVQVLGGIVVLALIFMVSALLHLQVLTWLFTKVATVVAVAFIVIFHPELRRGLARIGGEAIFRLNPRQEQVVEEIVKGVLALSRQRIGAILAIERQTPLRPYMETGVMMEAAISSELLQTIFMPNTPLHDGGVVISQGRLTAAACLFPLSENTRLSKTLGTRHRAAVGLSEETDAAVIVVSEETGIVSLAAKGELTRGIDREKLAQLLYEVAGTKPRMTHAAPSAPQAGVPG
ncbi:MAG: TIGR00159 family protein [Candidatus Omnitrophica bacterium]|nr:TIGR00159 family protein [Candidatus Omnitrophota bacterium]